MSRTSTPSYTNHVYHLSEALYDALTLHASKNFLGIRTGAIAHDDVTHVDKSEFQFKSFEQVRDDALAAATCLALDVQLSRRQFFGICCSNCYDWLLFEFACCFNDLPLVGINTSWKPDIVSYVINLSHIVCVACSAEFVPVFQALKQSCPSLSALVVIDADPLNPIPACSPQDPLHVYVWNASRRTVSLHHSPSSHAAPGVDLHSQDSRACGTTHTLTRVGMQDYLHLKLRGQLPALDQDDVHSLMFTSGTSGVPKGVVITKTRWYLDNKSGGIMANHADPAFLSYNSWSHGADRGLPCHPHPHHACHALTARR
jgi:long-subunit acyl-CoA synthetase (AMP-forming)